MKTSGSVVRYLGKYTHRVAISNSRILDIQNGKVTFASKNYAKGGEKQNIPLSATEFMRRFLLHILPENYRKIRMYGFLSNRAKGDDITDACLTAYPTENRSYAEREAKILMSTKRVQGLIKEEIEKVMNEAEITPLYILEKMKDIIESDGSRDSDKVSLLKELVAIAGMRDT